MLQTSVETVKPGGTGRPALVISARPAPLPPRRSFMVRLPSAFPAPKKWTYFLALLDGLLFAFVFFAIRLVRVSELVNWRFRPALFPQAQSPKCPRYSGSCGATRSTALAAQTSLLDRPPSRARP